MEKTRRQQPDKSAERVESMSEYKEGDMVVYGTEGLCRIEEIADMEFGGRTGRYYVLRRGESLTYVPVDNEKSVSKMRPLLTREEIMRLLDEMPLEDDPWISNNRERQAAFKEIMLYGDIKDVILLARKLKFKQLEQEAKGRRLHLADERVFREAEKVISEELAYVLGVDQEKVIAFLVDKLEK